ncbi:MAG: bifunctional adenosylcobinamide kinase/adenosylcobinamide-phosphate guanylyltransferase [Candidatus Rokubacteria bacterium 13_1_40CM_68_15]|nr:MAG: bifunctional adenosylcobinamide kinase/adenosylcobinamide-phosphate guanylyltransferase [Candidatus Rokubacteria bacterium 13_1_40CM_68_15]
MRLSHLILGGARSGKSRFAVAQLAPRTHVVFIATAQAGDRDMAQRIRRHRAERPSHWETIEEPYDLVGALAKLDGRADAVLVDCVTVWVANRLLRGDSDEVILGQVAALAAFIGRRSCDVMLVSNEVGEGVHPETVDGRRFRDLLGLVNQRLAAACEQVTLMVAGLPLPIKAPVVTGASRSDVAQQAP